MATTDFTKVLIKDDRIANLTDSVKYAVIKGGQNITSAAYTAQSATNSAHTYAVQVPSEQVIISREVMWSATITFQITGVPADGDYLVNYGTTDAFAPFPFNQMVETCASTINNNTVSLNVKDIIAPILRLHDNRELSRYNGLTPTMVDTFKHYDDAVGLNNNPLGSYGGSVDNDLMPRGAFNIQSIVGNTIQAGGGAAAGTLKTVYITVKITEPLLSSPWLFANPQENNQGFYGIQNLSFQFNLDATCRRAWRTSVVVPQYNVQVQGQAGTSGWADCKLIFTYISPHPSDLLPSRNVVPYYNLERYIYNQYDVLNHNSRTAIQSPTLQLNSIPDRIFVVARKRMTTQTYTDTDSFLVIEGISINFNNSSGLGSSFTQQDLYKMSVRNGVNQSWQEFSGYANGAMAAGALTHIPTSGSVLCLEFGTDIQLSEDYLSQGSLGSYQLSLRVNVLNQDIDGNAGANDYIPELMIITQTSGIMCNEKGTCSTFLGLLTKSDVLEASTQQPYSRSHVKRLVGGGFFDSLKSIAGKVLPKVLELAPLAKGMLGNMDNKVAQAASGALGALGYGKRNIQSRIQ